MKIVKQEKKKIISVLGAPHTGTTIVNNILNSMDNAFCISEPHWVLCKNRKKLKLDKIKNINFTDKNDFMEGLAKKLHKSGYDFGGVKETYRHGENKLKQIYQKIINMSDIVIFVYRDPAALYNSQKKIRPERSDDANARAIKGMMFNFEKQYELMKSCENKAVNIVLEDLCGAGNNKAIKYLNTVFAGKAQFEGPFSLHKTDFIFGNPQANRSNNLRPANMDTSLVTNKERRKLNAIYQTYESLKVKL